MGRCKLKIEQIRDSRKRATCFRKRAQGILKKVEELSILCNCQLALVIISENKNVLSFSTGEIDSVIRQAKQTMSRNYDNASISNNQQLPVFASECPPDHEASFIPSYYDGLRLNDAIASSGISAIPAIPIGNVNFSAASQQQQHPESVQHLRMPYPFSSL